jgi:hypothetical protein
MPLSTAQLLRRAEHAGANRSTGKACRKNSQPNLFNDGACNHFVPVAVGTGAARSQQQSVSLSFPQVGISVPAPSYYQRDGVGHHFYGYRLTMGFAWQPI